MHKKAEQLLEMSHNLHYFSSDFCYFLHNMTLNAALFARARLATATHDMHLQYCEHKGINVEFKCEFILVKYYFKLQLAAFFGFFLRAVKDSKVL